MLTLLTNEMGFPGQSTREMFRRILKVKGKKDSGVHDWVAKLALLLGPSSPSRRNEVTCSDTKRMLERRKFFLTEE